MNTNNITLEKRLRMAAHHSAVPSREAFRPLFELVTKNTMTRSPYQMFMSRLLRHKTLVISVATSLAVVMIVVIPSLQPTNEVNFQSETITAENSQEVTLLEQEDALVGTVVENYLGQLAHAGEQEQ